MYSSRYPSLKAKNNDKRAGFLEENPSDQAENVVRFLAGTSAVLILPALPAFAADFKRSGHSERQSFKRRVAGPQGPAAGKIRLSSSRSKASANTVATGIWPLVGGGSLSDAVPLSGGQKLACRAHTPTGPE